MRKFLISLQLKFAFAIFFMAAGKDLHAQCSSTISSFPYSENFEASNGNWIAGGNSSSWAWGLPAKAVINAASGSTKSWITGGLNSPGYNNNENSWLQSPCFNLSSLANPYITFKVFWETEKKYDGAGFQYSINGGTSWITLGSNADYVACPSNNWFNTNGINALGTHGWSGNIQPTAACTGGAGNGSGKWVIAQHDMAALAGQTNVRFRFTFAAGSVCNAYDGFAIDDIQIGEAPSATGNFTYTCTGSNTVSVNPSVGGCNVSYSWDFGDPVSGASNFSTGLSPTHFYSNPGPYTITMTANVAGFAPVIRTKQVNILQVGITVDLPIRCYGEKFGGLTATVSPPGLYQYSWNTSPVQNTASLAGIGSGSYTVSVTGAGACPASESVTLTEPAKLEAIVRVKDAFCGKSNGTLKGIPVGGVPPYTITWWPFISNADSLSDIPAGFYSLGIRDANGCIAANNFQVRNLDNLQIDLGPDTYICPGQKLVLSPGIFDSYKWQDNSTLSTFTVTKTGTYSVEVTNDSGCIATDRILVTVDCSDLWFPTGFTPNGNGLNEGFGALGNVAAISNFSLKVYNRWGELVFVTTDPSKKWLPAGSGLGTMSFVWLAEYSLPNRGKQVRKGVVTLIR
jgi:hypothetical protein